MRNQLSALRVIGGLGVGAGVMYLMDPDRGRRRRSIARDKLVHQIYRTGSGVDIAARDLAHRTQGLAARARRAVLNRAVDENVLIARVRSHLGRLVSHPHAIEVRAEKGRITLRGMIFEDELHGLQSQLQMVPGVLAIENLLKPYHRDEKVPALQGGKRRLGSRFGLMQENWSPSARFIVGAASAVPIAAGLSRRDLPGAIMAGIGTGFMVRALSNQGFRRFLGIGRQGMITVHKTINIDAPPGEIFRFWSELDNFTQFLPEVIEVRPTGQNRTHWTVAGPAGIPVRWNAVTTRFEPGSLLAWRSEPGALIENAGRVQFLANADGSTKVELDLSYRPPGGRLGHAMARLFGADPKSQLDDALLRVKSLIEKGPSERLLKFAAGF